MMVKRTSLIGDGMIQIAAGFWSRLFGLMFKKQINYGLWLLPCRSIHTFGMRFSIDVVYLDVWGEVVGWQCDVPPNRVVIAPKQTFSIIEYQSGQHSLTPIKIGQYFFSEMIDEISERKCHH